MKENEFEKFVSEVKEGDTWLSVQRDRGWVNRRFVSKVEFVKKTKTQIVVREDGTENRYRISNGYLIGGHWGGMAFPLPSSGKEIEEVRAANRVIKLRRSVRDFVDSHRLDEISEQVLKQVMDLLKGQTGSEGD